MLASSGSGFLVSSEDANFALVIRRSKFEPISRRDLLSFLSVVIWFAFGGSRKVVAAELVFSSFGTACGGTLRDSFVRAILIEFGHM